MAHPNVYPVNPGWRILVVDAGLNPTNVLRRAGLPDDVFRWGRGRLTTERVRAAMRAVN